MNKLNKPNLITGNFVTLRNVNLNDAEFILSLRTNPEKNKYLSITSNNINNQKIWLNNYSFDKSQFYFIITNSHNKPFGTIRLYDINSENFCWGSWILSDGAPINFALESMLIIYSFALSLGLKNSNFDVRRENISVCSFHERLGAIKTSEDELNIYYNLPYIQIIKILNKFKNKLPTGILIS